MLQNTRKPRARTKTKKYQNSYDGGGGGLIEGPGGENHGQEEEGNFVTTDIPVEYEERLI